ncbi:MAG: CBS domain-containing protein [Clostridia bacterium]|nr:CBS domain-containing protein [Clostridia bacterium]
MNLFYLLKPKSSVAYLYKTNTIRQGLEKMRIHGYSAIPVIDDNGEYIGTVSEGDFLWHILKYKKEDIKSQEQYSIIDIVNEERNLPVKINVTMDELLLRVMDQNFVPVIDDRNMFIGIITRKDIIKYFYDKSKKDNSEKKENQ